MASIKSSREVLLLLAAEGWDYDGTSDYGRITRQNAFLEAMFSRVKASLANPIAMIGSLAMAMRYTFERGDLADRIEAGTFLIAGAITGGDLAVTGCVPEHVGALVAKLLQAGAEITLASPSYRNRYKLEKTRHTHTYTHTHNTTYSYVDC